MSSVLKRIWLLGLAILCLPLAARAQLAAEPASDIRWAALSGTGYRIAVPIDWTVATQPDFHKAVMTATNKDGTRSILVFVTAKPAFSLSRWKKALENASRESSVSHIAEQTVGERCFLTYDVAIGDMQAWAAVTEVADGLFVTVEFRALESDKPRDGFAAMLEACLSTLEKEP